MRLDVAFSQQSSSFQTNYSGLHTIHGRDGKDGKDGKDGYSPIRGTDYWTEADKAEIIADVLAQIPEGDGGSGLSTDAARLLITILSAATFASDQSANIKALSELLLGPSEDPDIPPVEPEILKLSAPVIQLETIEQVEQLKTPIIRLESATDDEETPAILGTAVLGRTILGETGGTDLPKLSAPVIHLKTGEPLEQLRAPVIYLETEEEPEVLPKLGTPVISLETAAEPEPELEKLTAPEIYLEVEEDLSKLATPTIYLEIDEELPKLKTPFIRTEIWVEGDEF